MRKHIRIFLAVLGVAVALVAVAGPAFAQEGGGAQPKFADKAAKECFEKLRTGASVEDCQQAPSPLKPENNEIIWGTIAFLVLLGVMWKFGVPAVRNMERAREDRIRSDLEQAEQARSDAETELERYRAQMADARDEAGRIIDEARQAADQVRRDLIARAEADAAEIRRRAQQDIQVASDRAMADLRGRVADLSIRLAERIVEHSLDRPTQMALVERYIESVGNGSR